MFREKEIKYFNVLIAFSIALVLFAFISLAIFIYRLVIDGNINEVIFDLIAYGFYLFAICSIPFLLVTSRRKGSTVIKPLMYLRNNTKVISKPASIISMVFFVFNFLAFVYITICMAMPTIPQISFSIVLKYTILNVTLAMSVFSLAFFLYPRLVKEKK